MKRLCAIVLAAAALAVTAAPEVGAQPVAMMTCVGMEGLYPAPKCGPGYLPICNWDATKTCKVSRKRFRPQLYSSRCTAWHCTYIGPP
jgi:hypothetical protein